MTLQRLVELQAKYPGSVNLIELKAYLEAGQIDYRLDEYIDKVKSNIKLRSHVVQLVKKHLETTGDESVGVNSLHVAYIYSNPPQPLQSEALHEILVELSSPLTGYLGRKKGSDGSDRFYFLRDLSID
jgi:ubiquinone biosynthesis protein COQ9